MLRTVPPKVPKGGRFGQKASLNYGNLRDDLRKVSE